MRYLRNLGRRPVRTTLTVLGITIGIWALVVFGSMANKINALVEGGSVYYADKVIPERRVRLGRRVLGRSRCRWRPPTSSAPWMASPPSRRR